MYLDFQTETVKDYENGQLYALEKFWAFLKYYKHSNTLQVDSKLKSYLAKFKTIEDFRALEVSFQRFVCARAIRIRIGRYDGRLRDKKALQ